MTADREPTHWLQQHAGDPGTIELTAAKAAVIAQHPDAVGDYMSTAGLVWRERDPDARDGWAYYTITPVFGKRQ